MSRYFKALSLSVFIWGCEALPVSPGTACYSYGEQQCNYNLQCHENACWYKCEAVGDCDPGFLCTESGFCFPECEIGGQDCDERLTCRNLENGQQGSVCRVSGCFEDSNCREDEVCSYGRCTATCFGYDDAACLDYEYCDFDNRDRMTCQTSGFNESPF